VPPAVRGRLSLNGAGSRAANATDLTTSSALDGLTSNAGNFFLEDGATLTTTVGLTFNVAMARWNNRRAASASRRAQTSTSMTCPCWSIARYTYRQIPLTLT